MENQIVNNLRVLSLYEIEKAGSGHPGIALSSAPILYSLYANVMTYCPQDDKNIFRDRFVMSAGHGSSLLYATLHAFGFDLKMDDLKNFRKLNSLTPGHPEYNKTSGVDCSTGPLGQGVANAVGMALAGKHYQAEFNKNDIKLFDNKIYCLVGDGCLMEGISYEATSLAGNLNLDNLVIVYDCNKRTIDGSIDITWTEDVKKRFQAINFDVFEVLDGNSVGEITDALLKAKNSTKPSIVIVNTILGYGSEFADKSVVHGKPLDLKQIEVVKQNLNISVAPFELLDGVKQYLDGIKQTVKMRFDNQMQLLNDYKTKYPKDYERLLNYLNFGYNEKAEKQIKNFACNENQAIRDINHDVFSSFRIENFLGGSADVESSTKVFNKFDDILSKSNYKGKRICYGIREHAMAGISNGIALFGGLMAYASCFFSFVDYLKPALRMSALMNLPVLYVFTHDSYLTGEDGPTHQPIEQLVSVRAVPNLAVFRCYNLDELKSAYLYYLTSKKPTVIIISRAKYEMLSSSVKDASRGGYVVKKLGDKTDITIVATGSEVSLAIKTANILNEKGKNVKVVSMPSTNIFDSQDEKYRQRILPKKSRIFTLEAGSKYGLSKYVQKGFAIGLDNFGESASAEQLNAYFEFLPEKLANRILDFVK